VPVQDFGPAIAEILKARETDAVHVPSTVLLPHQLVLRESA
jgi:hypothetical protein